MSGKIPLAVVALFVVGQVGGLAAVAAGADLPNVGSDAERRVADLAGESIPDVAPEPDGPASTATLPGGTDVARPPAAVGGLPAPDLDRVPIVLLPPLGYSRYDDSDPLDNPVRRVLYETATESPGTHVASVADEAGVSPSTVRYHLRVLQREGLLETETVLGKHRVFPARTENAAFAAALNDRATATIVEAIDRDEPVTVSGIAEAVDRARSTVSYHLSRLEEAGVVARERDGRSVVLSLTAEPPTLTGSDALAD